eukprot:superscaffoldBa00002767_g15232
MSYITATLIVAILLSSEAFGKTVKGLLKSEVARQQNGQFITKFMYQGDDGLFVCWLENSALAVEKESRLLLYQDMEPDLDNLSCSDRLSRAQFIISLSQEEHNQTIPHQSSPTVWQALYADRYTCQESAAIPSHADLTFTVLLFNADSAGNPLDHFSAEEAGLHSFYFLLLLAYFIACCIYIQPLYQALRKGGPMHTVLKVLTTALALQCCSALCNYIHLASLGYGVPGVHAVHVTEPVYGLDSESRPETSVQTSAVGTVSGFHGRRCWWSRYTASETYKSHLNVAELLTAKPCHFQGVLLLWEQYSESESDHHSYHAQQSLAGLLLIALRVGLALLLASVLYQIISTERSTLKRDFYLCFAKGCFLWFLCHPVLVLLSVVFNDHQKEKVVTIGVILCQSISMVILYQLFLSRSLYWEVSSLSSVSLPLTMSRTNHRGRY